MRKLLTFETFVPKNITTRDADFKRIEAEQQAAYHTVVTAIATNLERLQGLTVADPQEQLFIDLMQHITLKYDRPNNPYNVFFFNQDQLYVFVYDWKHNIFMCHVERVCERFKTEFKLNFKELQSFIQLVMLKYFHWQPAIVYKCH